MLIQRSRWPSRTSSTISTLGASGSCGRATTPPRDRAVRRRRGLGRFGTGTSRLVGQHEIRSTLQSTGAFARLRQAGRRPPPSPPPPPPPPPTTRHTPAGGGGGPPK